MKTIFRVIALVAAIAATYYITIDASSIGSSATFMGYAVNKSGVYIAAAIVALSIAAPAVAALVEWKIGDPKGDIGRQAYALLAPFWYATTMAISDPELRRAVAVHIWMIPRWHWTLVPYGVRHLFTRRFRRRLPTPPMWHAAVLTSRDPTRSTEVAFRRGKGVIGACWRTRREFHFPLYERWPEGLTEAEWTDPSNAIDRLHLTYDEYVQISEKYDDCYAVPIFGPGNHDHDKRLIGCVVIDVSKGFGGKVQIKTEAIDTAMWSIANELWPRIVEYVK